MKPPCEVIVNKVLPTIRAAIVKELIDEYKMKQLEISKILGISQSAISQYYTSARAGDKNAYNSFPEIVKYAKKIARRIARGELKSEEILLCEPCQLIRKNKKFDDFQEEVIQLMRCKICHQESKR